MNTFPEEKWREVALNAVLDANKYGGGRLDALLLEVRRIHPHHSFSHAEVVTQSWSGFLQKRCESESLLGSSLSQWQTENKTLCEIYFAWHRVQWQGKTLEVVTLPYYEDKAVVVAMGERIEDCESLIAGVFEYSKQPGCRTLRYAEGWEDAPDLDEEVGKVQWSDIVLPDDQVQRLRESVDGFFAHRKTFESLGFAWRRGILLVGPPGTGKTMICKAVAASTSLPFLYVRDVREYHHEEALGAIFKRARELAPCVLAFEDIDGFVNPGNRTTFLNEMDGFQNNNGLLVIASSNHPGQIDEALLKRPSRFDRVFHIGLPKKPERIEYCCRLLSRSSLSDKIAPELDRDKLALQVGEKSTGFTPAYLKEAFISAALHCAQNGIDTLDERFARAVLEQVAELRAHIKRAKNAEAMGEMNDDDDVIGLRR